MTLLVYKVFNGLINLIVDRALKDMKELHTHAAAYS